MTRRALLLGAALAGAFGGALAAPAQPSGEAAGTVVVGSKNFEESRLLAELFAQLLEQRTGLTVERRLNLAGTQVCFEALRSGDLDLYPEYTGTGQVSILGEPAARSREEALRRVRSAFLERWDLHWLSPLGFENAYELAVRRELAERHGLRTLSDLARVAPTLRAGLGFEFVERPDGLPGLAAAYGLHFASVQPMQQAIKLASARSGAIDVLDVYSTDGTLATGDPVVLADDLSFFPPYEAAALVRGEALRRHPEIGAALGLLGNALSVETMRSLNARLQIDKEDPEFVAAEALAELGLGARTARPQAERSGGRGLLSTLWQRRSALGERTLEHLALSASALGLGIVVALPLGLLLERRRRWGEPFIRALAMTQTVPSLALLAFMVPWLGVGATPALVALWIYSLFPIVRATYTGLLEASPAAVTAATALGMSPRQVLMEVRLPLAVPVVMAGIRTSAVLTVGTATLAAFIGAGGLGEPIVTGLQLADSSLILSGALPAALMAVLLDAALGSVERRLRARVD